MKRNLIILFSLLFFFNGLVAQQNQSEKGLLVQDGRDTVKVDIVNAFAAFRSPLYSDPGMPAFTFVSKNKNMALGIGGYVRFTASYDFGGSIDSRDFVVYKIPMISSRAQNSRFQTDASTTRLYLRFLRNTRWGLFHFYIDNDFRAENNIFRFNFIYASLGGWKLGRNWSVMADLETFPPSVDFQGPNSFAGISTYQLSYHGNLSTHFSFGAGLEVPDYSIDDSLSTAEIKQTIPTFPFYLQVQGGWGHVRLSGVVRPLGYKNVDTGRDRYAFTWGGILSAILKPTTQTSIFMQSVYGKGIGNYVFDLNGAGLDLIPSVANPGKLVPLELWGGFVGARQKITSNVGISATYSYLRAYDGNNYYPALYKQGQYVTTTFYYDILSKLQLAFEYDFGHLKHFDNQNGRANRVMGMIRYDF